MNYPTDFCKAGDRFNNGNGSIMRLAPISITYRKDLEDAMYKSLLSSRTTHNGQEAEECCRLLTCILVKLYKRNSK
jgi:ADP-ribosylglycohydrolase